MDSVDYGWEEYPVVNINFANAVMATPADLNKSLSFDLRLIAKRYDILLGEVNPVNMFRELIVALHEKAGIGVVILVDEYDKPWLDYIEDKDRFEQFSAFMESFYMVLKECEDLLRFVFITGVTHFSNDSILGRLDNLTDISTNSEYSCMLGYTQDEFERYFSEWIDNAVELWTKSNRGITYDRNGILFEIRMWYGGFLFCPGVEPVYNPVAIGKFFRNRAKFSNYWFSTGTPAFLVKLLKRNSLMISDIAGASLDVASLGMLDASDLMEDGLDDERITSLLFQSGYLTLSEDSKVNGSGKIALRFPNYDVESSITDLFIMAYAPLSAGRIIDRMQDAAEQGRTADMIAGMKEYLSTIPVVPCGRNMSYFHTIVHCMAKGRVGK